MSGLFTGIICGLLNGLFGSGGGAAAVPLLKKAGLETKSAHASSLALTLPLSAVSLMFYFMGGSVPTDGLFMLILCGLGGAALGTFLLKIIKIPLLKKIFGALLIISAVRIFTR